MHLKENKTPYKMTENYHGASNGFGVRYEDILLEKNLLFRFFQSFVETSVVANISNNAFQRA